jgi:hypothetical protein
MTAYRTAAVVLAVVFAGIGIALIVETAIVEGSTGYLLGGLFVLAGLGRLYLLFRRPPD